MKKVRLFLVMSVSALVFFTACEKSDPITVESADAVVGTYIGTLSLETGLKSTNGANDATVDVTETTDGQLEIHCYGGDIDTTFMLNYYENGDSTMVCLNGDAFEEMYGHMMGDGQNGDGTMGQGGMMGSTGNMDSQMSWGDHMNSEHQANDEHFGGFDMTNDTFDYTMQTGNGDLRFQGTKTNL